ncbi:AfsR/SARP family transcriptional regulator [Longispora albida]|uniref:AfsR/SARP family transcriptional regulator n=1 Tax=Longispora albida TaxID=203523 RepID=UPI00037BD4C3|nr:BTAD domain-containing putative transcriptional regulator [Longispora albida]
MLDVGLLGTVTVSVDGGQAEVGSGKQACFVAALALYAGQPVPMDTLISRVWGEAPPPAVRSTLYSQIARIRRLIPAGLIARRGGGYVLDVPLSSVDVFRMRALAAEGSAAACSGDLAGATALWREAAALWRGPALAGATGDWADRTRAGLDQERLALLGQLHDAELALGRHAEIVAALAGLVAEYPLNEPLTGQLMLALHRSGRTAEALDRYAQARARLRDELGTEPGPALADLHQQLLLGAPPATDPVPSGGPAARPRQLPAAVPSFTGRSAELAELDGAAGITVLAGTGGAGKTALALHWAHRAAAGFPDGQLFVDLRGYSPARPLPPEEVLSRFLRALGVPPAQIPQEPDEQAALYRSLLADRRMLIVLDNAASPAQVRQLLPGTPHSRVVITSRGDLRGLAATHDFRTVHLGVLTEPDAVGLLTGVLGPLAPSTAEAAELARLCGYLPLALRLVAAGLAADPDQRASDLVAQLGSPGRLAALASGDDPQAAVRATFELSYRAADPEARRVFRLLGLSPAPEPDPAAITALTGTDPAGALDRLAAAYLIEPSGDRWRLHDLLREYAADLSAAEDTPAERDAAIGRLLGWYLDAATVAATRMDPTHVRTTVPGRAAPEFADHGAALAWFETERPALVALVGHASAAGLHSHTWRLAHTLTRYFHTRGYLADWLGTGRQALTAARELAEPHAEGEILNSLGLAYGELGRLAEATECHERAIGLRDTAGDLMGQARSLGNFGNARRKQGHTAESVGYYDRALALFEELGDSRGTAMVLNCRAIAYVHLGHTLRAVSDYEQALKLVLDGFPLGRATLLLNYGNILSRRGHWERAIGCFHESRALFAGIGDTHGEGACVATEAHALLRAGRYSQAVEAALAAVDMFGGLDGQPDVARPHGTAAVGLARLGRHEEAAAHCAAIRALVIGAGDPPLFRDVFNAIGECELAAGDPAAEATFRAVLAAGDADLYQSARALLGLAQALGAAGSEYRREGLDLLSYLDLPEPGC